MNKVVVGIFILVLAAILFVMGIIYQKNAAGGACLREHTYPAVYLPEGAKWQKLAG